MSTSSPHVFKSSLASVLNFRDIGATINQYSNAQSLQPSRLFRSARPDDASSGDRHAIQSVYGIRTIIDLRSKTEHIEQAKKHDNNTASTLLLATNEGSDTDAIRIKGIRYVDINLNGGAFSRALLWKLKWFSLAKLLTLMAAGYRTEAISILGKEVMEPRGLVGLGRDSLDYSRREIRDVFEVLALQSNYPILVHCTQGKDRTGLVVILLLALLDTPVGSIDADYRASQRELETEKEARLKEIRSIGLSESFAECPEGFVESVLQHIDKQYGGVSNYLQSCGVRAESLERIKQLMLQL